MKKPVKPKAPRKPREPKEFKEDEQYVCSNLFVIDGFPESYSGYEFHVTFARLDEYRKNVEDVARKCFADWSEPLKPATLEECKIIFEGSKYLYLGYKHVERTRNPKFVQQVIKYDLKLSQYKVKLAKWELDLAKYKENLEAYTNFKLDKEIAKIDKKLVELEGED